MRAILVWIAPLFRPGDHTGFYTIAHLTSDLPGGTIGSLAEEDSVMVQLTRFWGGEDGQDIAEYAVMLAVILVGVVGTIRLVGSNANNAFSSVASSIQ